MKHIIVLLLLCSVWIAHAETAEDKYDTNVPDEAINRIIYTYDTEADIDKTDGAKADMHELDMLFSFPYLENDTVTLLAGVGYKWNHVEFTEFEYGNEDLYIIKIPLDVIYTGVDNWTFWFRTAPGLFSDLDRLEDDDFSFPTHALAFYKLRPGLSFIGGAAYNREFGDDKVFPVGGVRWLIGKTWRLNLLFPESQIAWSPTPNWMFHADVGPAGDKWNMRVDDETFDFKLEGMRSGIGGDYKLNDHTWLRLATGIEFARKYTIGNNNEELLDADVDDAWYVQAGVVIR